MIQPGVQFASDNTAGICPQAWAAIEEANSGFQPSYGDDPFTREACDLFRELFETDCDVYFVFTGTAANSLSIASMCRSYHGVIAHPSAHMATDECGAPEFFSGGAKLLPAGGDRAKLDPREVGRVFTGQRDLHSPKPRAMSVSQGTEFGTVYRAEELKALRDIARGHGVLIHMDGARFSNAIASLDCAPADVTWRAGVDVLCFGGTKLGMAVTEAVIFFNRELGEEFAWRCKQAGQLASKMRFMSAQWRACLRDGFWLTHARHANALARELAEGLKQIPGVKILHPVEANGVFVELPAATHQRLHSRGWHFYDFTGGGSRFMCSWRTSREDVAGLLADAAGK